MAGVRGALCTLAGLLMTDFVLSGLLPSPGGQIVEGCPTHKLQDTTGEGLEIPRALKVTRRSPCFAFWPACPGTC